MPVTRDFVNSTGIGWAAGHWIGSINVDGIMSGQNNRPVIIVKLSGEEKRAGKAVVFCAVVSVVFVGRNCVPSEAAVLSYVSGKQVVMAENDWFAVTANRQLGRNGSVEGPHRQRSLIGKIGMELGMN